MTGTSHAKIILIGEHSVVYGHKAIAIPVFELTTRCSLKVRKENHVTSALYTGPFTDLPETMDPLKKLAESLQNTFDLPKHEHIIESDIPVGAGFGSSAALATSVVRAYDTKYDLKIDDDALFKWVQYFERLTHDNPSGIDALTVIHDTPWIFSKEGKTPLPMHLGAYLVIADTLERTPTKESVSHVASLSGEPFFTPTLNRLGALGEKAITAIRDNDVHTLATLMTRFMEGLSQLNLSTEKTEDYIETAINHGALAAKLTGGGMGGCVIALAETLSTAKAIEKALEETHGAPVWISTL
mgnify:CR=1 FL=1